MFRGFERIFFILLLNCKAGQNQTAIMRKRFFSCILFLFVISAGLEAQDTVRIDNAYYLAKALSNYKETRKDSTLTMLVLGGVQWYMEDHENSEASEIENEFGRYPIVKKYYDSLLKRFQKDNQIFDIG